MAIPLPVDPNNSTINPYSRAYSRIIQILELWQPLMAVVKIANVQTLQTPGYVPRTNVGAADRIELKLLQAGGKEEFDSMFIIDEMLYPLIINSGSLGIDKANQVWWLVRQALLAGGRQLGLLQHVADARLVPSKFVPSDITAGRPDWTVVCGVAVQFKISNADLLNIRFTG